MKTYRSFSLKHYNTFGIDELADEFRILENEQDVIDLAADPESLARLKLILGGGSNLLLTGPVRGLVAHVAVPGRYIIDEDEDEVIIEAGAGENWHDLVLWTMEHRFGGLENLSLIPGQVGTAPVQNIGAYGVELKDHFHSLDGIEVGTGEKRTLSHADCDFGYRDSIFKRALRNKFIITAVRLKLSLRNHKVRTGYGAIRDELMRQGIEQPTIADVSRAVIAIRQSKLPDPAEIGNSGSFFKNPLVGPEEYERIKEEYPDLVAYPAGDGLMKLAAGWLIEQAGWKGYREGDAGVHKKQALVLVNYGSARGQEVYSLAGRIMEDINKRFGVSLEAEVNIL